MSFRDNYPKVRLVNKVITDNKGLYTSGGANSYWNLLIYLAGKFSTHELAIRLSNYFEMGDGCGDPSSYADFVGSRLHDDDAIQKVQDLIEREYQRKLSLDNLADFSLYGQRTFQRKFKKATGHTVNAYIQKVRIEAAKKLLELNILTVGEIIYEVGYQDFHTFRRIFKRETGVTPIKYRTKFHPR